MDTGLSARNTVYSGVRTGDIQGSMYNPLEELAREFENAQKLEEIDNSAAAAYRSACQESLDRRWVDRISLRRDSIGTRSMVSIKTTLANMRRSSMIKPNNRRMSSVSTNGDFDLEKLKVRVFFVNTFSYQLLAIN